MADTGGIDTAYRIIADHARMLTVAISDGLRPGRGGLEQVIVSLLNPLWVTVNPCFVLKTVMTVNCFEKCVTFEIKLS